MESQGIFGPAQNNVASSDKSAIVDDNYISCSVIYRLVEVDDNDDQTGGK